MVELFFATAVLAAVQQAPELTIEVDRTRVSVGESIILTVSAETSGNALVRLESSPAFTGFDVVGTSQSSVFTVRASGGVRASSWEYRLRAALPGRHQLGPIRLRVDGEVVESDVLVVEVEGGADGATAIPERLLNLARRAAGPDGTDEVIVSVVAEPDTIVQGEQLDLLVAAWFPRQLRARLRARPALTPPTLEGAWTYATNAALGVAASRVVDGTTYDLFLHHQIVFPLTSGPFAIGPARVTYNLPVRVSIFSREVPQEIQSNPLVVPVLAQPSIGRSAGFSGAAGTDVSIDVQLDTTGLSAGRGGNARISVTGSGNASLWPEPSIRWPTNVRVYPGDTDVSVTENDGVLGGTKTFTYLLVPDSAGSYFLPEARFPYYDLSTGEYREAVTNPIRFLAGGTSSVAPVRTRYPLLTEVGSSPFAVISQPHRWQWWTVVILAPLACVLASAWHRRRRVRTERTVTVEIDERTLALRHSQTLRRLIRARIGSELHDSREAVAKMVGAGIDVQLAERAVTILEALESSLFGPSGTVDSQLARDASQTVTELSRAQKGVLRTVSFALALVCVSGTAAAQQGGEGTAESLYEAGLYPAAATQFEFRADRASSSYDWVNAGSAWLSAGDVARARLALVRAARLQPRSAAVSSRLAATPSLDGFGKRLLWVSPFTVQESAGLGALLWIIGCGVYAWRRLKRTALAFISMALLSFGYAGIVAYRYDIPAAVVTAMNLDLRSSPHVTAEVHTTVTNGTAVRVGREWRAWLFVEHSSGSGWVPASDIGVL